MPGIRIMNSSAPHVPAAPRDGDSKKRDHQGRLVNGDSTGVHSESPAVAVATAGGAQSGQDADLSPPKITHIPSELYNPLSVLLERTAQECYNDLGEVLAKMADMPLGPATNGLPNGLIPLGPENAEANRKKKLILLKYAQDNRSKFIKLLVLTEWGKKVARDVAKLIDLFAWTQEQSAHMEYLDEQLQRIKIHSNVARENSPDINTALEILSTGKAHWMPDLGFIPPEPVSSEQALKLLQHMNTSLSIRLNLHEKLPRHLRNWHIHSGRVTFVIPNEFEFDLISFVEDASSQWSFIDIRLLFSPAPVIAVGSPFFMTLKFKADQVLAKSGLSGLFDFLYNVILTHKISVLRSQAVALIRTSHAGSLKVEPVHRELVVQYWTNKPGKKNWIDIGVAQNRPKNGKSSWRGPPLPSLKTRWFCEGKEVKDAQLEFDWNNLSMERMIKQVIARHTGDILRATKDSINSRLMVDLRLSATEPADCKLKNTLGPKSNAITMSLEPMTGRYLVQPANPITARAETAFNQGREPAVIGHILTQALAQTLLASIQSTARQLGWPPVSRQSLHPKIFREAVNLDVLQYALFTPRGWSSKWAFAVVIDTRGESWWVLELGPTGSTVEYAEHIKMERLDERSLVIDRATLASLERVAVQLLSFRVTARELEKESKPCSLQYNFSCPSTSSYTTETIARGWALCIQTSDLLVMKSGEQPWLESTIAIHCQGLRADGQHVWHIATGRMVKAAATDMQKLMATSPPCSFQFANDGRFCILLSTPFGHNILGELRARLRDVNRLRFFATTLKKRKLRLVSSSLQKVQFEYGPSPHSATVNFGSESEFIIKLSSKNPHHRVLGLLTAIANDRLPGLPCIESSDSNGLDRFCTTLLVTRSLLKVLCELESRTAGNVHNPAVHVHSIFKYRITYENPVCIFDIRLQPKDDKVYWFLEDNHRTRGQDTRVTAERLVSPRRLETLQAKLKEVFSSKGTGWFGTRNGIVAELDAVADALRKLDACVLQCKMEGGYQAPPPMQVPMNEGGDGILQKTQQHQHQHQQKVNQQARMQLHQQQQLQQQQQQQQQAARQQAQAKHHHPPAHQQVSRTAHPPGLRQQPSLQNRGIAGATGPTAQARSGQSQQDVITID